MPQSCIHAAMFSSYRCSSLKSKSPNGPSLAPQAASAIISVITGTRWQWPPVYGDFRSMAVAIKRMKDSSKFFWASDKSWLSRAIAAWLANASTNGWEFGEKGVTVSESGVRALINCNTQTTSFS